MKLKTEQRIAKLVAKIYNLYCCRCSWLLQEPVSLKQGYTVLSNRLNIIRSRYKNV